MHSNQSASCLNPILQSIGRLSIHANIWTAPTVVAIWKMNQHMEDSLFLLFLSLTGFQRKKINLSKKWNSFHWVRIKLFHGCIPFKKLQGRPTLPLSCLQRPPSFHILGPRSQPSRLAVHGGHLDSLWRCQHCIRGWLGSVPASASWPKLPPSAESVRPTLTRDGWATRLTRDLDWVPGNLL